MGQNSYFGVVRETEKEIIKGVEYSSYEDMAYKIAKNMSDEAFTKFGEHNAKIIHRIGFVPV